MKFDIKDKIPDKTNWVSIDIELNEDEIQRLHGLAKENEVDLDVLVNHIVGEYIKESGVQRIDDSLPEFQVDHLHSDQYIKSKK